MEWTLYDIVGCCLYIRAYWRIVHHDWLIDWLIDWSNVSERVSLQVPPFLFLFDFHRSVFLLPLKAAVLAFSIDLHFQWKWCGTLEGTGLFPSFWAGKSCSKELWEGICLLPIAFCSWPDELGKSPCFCLVSQAVVRERIRMEYEEIRWSHWPRVARKIDCDTTSSFISH